MDSNDAYESTLGKRKYSTEPDEEPEMWVKEENSKLSLHEPEVEPLSEVEEGKGNGLDPDQDDVDNLVVDCGIIKRIECTDFMCHKQLTVALGPKINFITGQNGSGKSAIIAALQICLGMNAKETHRGSQLKNMIRHGSEGNATVRVVLTNDGGDAYKKELYGPEITVERVIKRVGGSGYKLISAAGKTISNKKKDLNELIDQLHLLVNNKCCILDQENSKVFLNGSRKEKYQLFIQASMLQHMLTNYEHEKAYRGRAKEVLNEKKKLIPQLEQDVEQAKSALRQLNTLEDLEKRRVDLLEQRVWAFAQDSKAVRDEATETEGRAKRKMLKAEAKANKLDEVRKTKEAKLEALTEESKDTMNKLDDCRTEMVRLKEEQSKKRAPRKKLERECIHAERQVEQFEKQRMDLKDEISKLRKKILQGDKESEKCRLIEEIQRVEDERASIELEYNSVDKKINEYVQQKNNLEEGKAEAMAQFEESKKKLRELRKELRELEATNDDARMRFGKEVPKLLEMIENESRFKRQPVHVGMHVELLEKDFWKPVEKHLGFCLRSFLVTDTDDKKLLQNMARKAKAHINLNILTRRFLDKRHVTKEIKGPLLTMEKAIRTDDDNVYNALVDFAQIEGQALVRTTNDAMKETFLGPRGKKCMPTNMVACHDRNGNKFSVKMGSESKVSYEARHSQSKYFSNDVSSEIEDLKRSINESEHESDQHGVLVKDYKEQIKACKKRIKNVESSREKMIDKQSELEETIHSLTQKQVDNDHDDDIVALEDKEENLQSLTKAIEKQQEELKSAKERLRRFDEQLLPLEEERKKAKRKFDVISSEVEGVTHKLTKFGDEVSLVVGEFKQAEARLQRAREKLTGATEEANTAQEAFAKAEAGALKFCKNKRLEPTETEQTLKKRIKVVQDAIDKEMEQRNNSGVSSAVLLERAKAKVKRSKFVLENRKSDHRKVRKRFRNLKESVEKRKEKFEEFKAWTQRVTSLMFDNYLSQRNHTGTITFDDDTGAIYIKWAKSAETYNDQEKDKDTYTDTRQLSGGEKSFTTLAFLLAMGAVVDCPFRVMDEFDVFMDPANRKAAMDLLVEMAKHKHTHTKQFIFITPNDISMVKDDPDVRKLRMHPPAKEYGDAGGRSQRRRTN